MCVKTLGFAQTHKGMIPLTSLIKLPLPPQLIEGNFFRQEASKGNSTVDLCYSPVHRLYVLSLRQDRIFRYHSLRSFLMLRYSPDFARSLSIPVVIPRVQQFSFLLLLPFFKPVYNLVGITITFAQILTHIRIY